MPEFSFKEITPGLRKENYSNGVNRETAQKILEEGGISKEGGNLTPVDLFSIPEGLSHEKKVEIIAKNLGFKKEDLEQNKHLEEISRYLQDAKAFLKEILMTGKKNQPLLPREIEKLEKFESVEELVETLSRTTKLKKGERLGYSPHYCALASLMIVEQEFDKESFEGLINESRYVAENLFEPDQSGNIYFHLTRKPSDDKEWSSISINTAPRKSIPANFSYRGKTKDSVIMKLANYPEYSSELVIKDGIGLKFEIEEAQEIKDIITFLVSYLQENFEAEGLIFENTRLLDETEGEFVSKILKSQDVIYKEDTNPSSHKNFKSVKLRGTLKVPQGGEDGKMIIPRNFEAQIVLTNNQNETGLSQNAIYKRVQKLSIFTRLYGSFSEEYLDAICQEASEATEEKGSRVSPKKIKAHILNNYVARLMPDKSKKVKYVSYNQYRRWEKAGVIPSGIKINEADREKLEKS